MFCVCEVLKSTARHILYTYTTATLDVMQKTVCYITKRDSTLCVGMVLVVHVFPIQQIGTGSNFCNIRTHCIIIL